MSLYNVVKCCKRNAFITAITGIVLGSYGSYAYLANTFEKQETEQGDGPIVIVSDKKTTWADVFSGSLKVVKWGSFAIIQYGGSSIAVSYFSYKFFNGWGQAVDRLFGKLNININKFLGKEGILHDPSIATLSKKLDIINQRFAKLNVDTITRLNDLNNRAQQMQKTTFKGFEKLEEQVSDIKDKKLQDEFEKFENDFDERRQKEDKLIKEINDLLNIKDEPEKPGIFMNLGKESNVGIFEKYDLEEEYQRDQNQGLEIIENNIQPLLRIQNNLVRLETIIPVRGTISLYKRYEQELYTIIKEAELLPIESIEFCTQFYINAGLPQDVGVAENLNDYVQIEGVETVMEKLETSSLNDLNRFLEAGLKLKMNELVLEKFNEGDIYIEGDAYKLEYVGGAEARSNKILIDSTERVYEYLSSINLSKPLSVNGKTYRIYTRYILPVFKLINKIGLGRYSADLVELFRFLRMMIKGGFKNNPFFPDIKYTFYKKEKDSSRFVKLLLIASEKFNKKTSNRFMVPEVVDKYFAEYKKNVLEYFGEDRFIEGSSVQIQNPLDFSESIALEEKSPILERAKISIEIIRATIKKMFCYLDFIMIYASEYESTHRARIEDDDKEGKLNNFVSSEWEKRFR